MRFFAPTAVALAATVVAGCASFSPPERDPYLGQDSVGAIDSDMLIGDWTITALNPLEGQPEQTTTISYLADGTYKGAFEVPDTTGVTGDMAFEMTGNWTVAGEQITHSNLEMTSTSDNNAFGSFISSMMSKRTKQMEGSANVYEASAEHLVTVDQEGQAMRFDRIN